MMVVLVIIGLSALILVHEFGHFLAAKLSGVGVEEFGIGFPPRLFGKKFGGTLYSLNLLPFGGFVKMSGEDGEGEPVKNSFNDAPVSRRSAIILAGVLMNIVLGWFILTGVFAVGAPEHLMIVDVSPGSPAETAGLESGDVIIEATIGGVVLGDPIRSDIFAEKIRDADSTILLTVRRGDEIADFRLEPRENPPEGEGRLGVSLADIGFAREPLGRSIVKGFSVAAETLKLIVVGLWTFFGHLFVSPEVLDTVAGPVGIFVLGTQAGELGLVYFFQLLAFISLNLAVLNLIPFPALDGGRFLMLVFEKIRRKPVPRRVQVAVNTAGFIFLIVLMIIITWSDVSRIVK
ncbi:MAG TPA: site-2 protease family protein [Candidatus Paceibacterota bacterium]|nr:site-2 protease family protein [Candidatus Paceibacterota bacterium]